MMAAQTLNNMKKELSNQEPASLGTYPINTGLAIFDTGQFEQMYRVAEAMAKTSLVPETLKGDTDEQTTANCFLVVEQSLRWGFSPFALMGTASVVYGRLNWEGKTIHAALEALTGVNLSYDIEGEGEQMKVTVSGTLEGESKPRTIEGDVASWKTTGNGSPWTPKAYARQLRYRGAREWTRAHKPGVILGILSEDESENYTEMRDANPKKKTLIARDEPITPGNESAPETSTERKVTPPQGKQKKERFTVDAEVISIEGPKATTNAKEYHLVTLQKSDQRSAQFSVFSSTLLGEIKGIPPGEFCCFTYTKDEKGRMTLEAWDTLDALDATLTEEGIA